MSVDRYALIGNNWVPFKGGTPVPPGQGTPVFEDHFDGTTLDLTKWTVLNNVGHSNELAYLTNRSQNLFLKDSNLHIVAQKETLGGRSYTSGYIHTRDKWTKQYGRFEMRAKLPVVVNESAGMWPAFWLRPGTGTSGFDGELDIMEAWGTPANTSQGANYPGLRYDTTIWKDETSKVSIQNWSPRGTDLSLDFHTYAVEWRPGSMQFYFDNVFFGDVTIAEAPWLDASYSGPMGIILNLQVGNTFWGDPDANTIFPGEFIIDYVRVYEVT